MNGWPKRMCLAAVMGLWLAGAVLGQVPERDESDDRRLNLVRDYAERVLEKGADRWSGQDTPLLADGVHVDTHEPVQWIYNGESYIISNLASQQNLFRVLKGLSNLLDEPRYEQAARDAIAYHFEHLADRSGLLKWGGHQFVDLASLQPVGHFDADCHELKNNFPFYELMWEVDQQATARFLRAFWQAHIRHWDVLDMNRHGSYGASPPDPRQLWARSYEQPEPFYEGDGLSFINTGSDLIHAAGVLGQLGEEEQAWTWGQRLARLYVDARHPDTGLGAYQYSKPRRRAEPPEQGPLEGNLTWSSYGDRAQNQFGRQFGEVAREGWTMWGPRLNTIYVRNAFMQLGLGESMDEGDALIEWTADGLEALAEHAYMPEENAFRPMWADGTDLSGKQFERTGYYGREGTQWRAHGADMGFLMTYARAYRLTGREVLWSTARQIGQGLGLGDIGTRPGQDVDLNMQPDNATPQEIFALLELHRAAGHEAYLDRARRVADRMIERRYHHGFFMPSADHVHANFDRLEPLAILALEATLRGQPELVPPHLGGRGYIHGRFDGHGRTYDSTAIWSVTRD